MPTPDDLADEARAEIRREANEHLAMGGAIGAIGVASAALFGAVCPVCIVATPALLGLGAYKRFKGRGVETPSPPSPATEASPALDP